MIIIAVLGETQLHVVRATEKEKKIQSVKQTEEETTGRDQWLRFGQDESRSNLNFYKRIDRSK